MLYVSNIGKSKVSVGKYWEWESKQWWLSYIVERRGEQLLSFQDPSQWFLMSFLYFKIASSFVKGNHLNTPLLGERLGKIYCQKAIYKYKYY